MESYEVLEHGPPLPSEQVHAYLQDIPNQTAKLAHPLKHIS